MGERKRVSTLRLLLMRRATYEAHQAAENVHFEAALLRQRIRQARTRVALLTEALSPGHRQAQTEALAKWQAHLDALLDDGVEAIQKGDE